MADIDVDASPVSSGMIEMENVVSSKNDEAAQENFELQSNSSSKFPVSTIDVLYTSDQSPSSRKKLKMKRKLTL